MDNSLPYTFHFFSEISKEQNYSKLFPDPKAGLAIIWLYERIELGVYPQKSFKEKDIHDALLAVNPSIEANRSRHPKEHYNSIISELQEYFLRYDEERQEYSFKEYAFDFCRQAHNILKATFSPTRIEKICYGLHAKLESCANLEQLLDWFKIELDAFQPQLKSQLDFLDRQIDQSVIDFRENKKLSLQEGAILDTLKQVDERFEIIRGQNNELRSAFREIDEIRRLMEKFSANYDNTELDRLVHSSITFFQEMRRTLGIIDRRLDRIQPRIKQLFSNLNKPLFNVRVERFIRHLVENSTERTEGSKKITLLPLNIPSLSVDTIPLYFTIIERKADLFPVRAKKRLLVPESPEAKARAFASFQQRLGQQDEISSWLEKLQQVLQSEKQIILSDYFFKIAQAADQASLTLAVAVIYRAVGFFERQNKYVIDISPDIIVKHPSFQTTLWQVIISNKT